MRLPVLVSDGRAGDEGRGYDCADPARVFEPRETCKLNVVDPQAYLGDVIARIVAGRPQGRIDELMPWAYAPQPLKAMA